VGGLRPSKGVADRPAVIAWKAFSSPRTGDHLNQNYAVLSWTDILSTLSILSRMEMADNAATVCVTSWLDLS